MDFPCRLFGASVLRCFGRLAVAVRALRPPCRHCARFAPRRRPGDAAAPKRPSSAPYGALSQRRICVTHFGLRTMRYTPALRTPPRRKPPASTQGFTPTRYQRHGFTASLSPRGKALCASQKGFAPSLCLSLHFHCALLPVFGLALLCAGALYALRKLKNDKID